MALADAMNAMSAAVEDAVAEIRSLANTIATTGDVQAATDQLTTLASNLEQAVSDAQAPSTETPPVETPPAETPPMDSPPV